MKVSELIYNNREERLNSWGLTGNENAIQVYDWEDRPGAVENESPTYFEEWDIYDEKENQIGCLYDTGNGYDYAAGLKAGGLVY
jgi:hypothetical protein